MRGVIVAIDLETTGLDFATDRIIEIGAVKFQENQILETYTTLIDPEITLPPKITAITGIRPESLIGAPKIKAVLPTLTQFVGDAPVLGHNVEFDLRFLNRHGILTTNGSIDTYELASVLLPAAPRYNLNALMQFLNLTPEGDYHRALADALATARVYDTLWHKLLEDVPFGLLREIMLAAETLGWRGSPAFAAAYAERLPDASPTPDVITEVMVAEAPVEALQSRTPAAAIDVELLVTLVPEPGEAIRAAAEALNDGSHLILEGNYMTYLAPAITWAERHGEHVVIATATESLGDQLIQREIPALGDKLGVAVKAVRMKGRADYLCPRRLAAMRRIRPTSVEELRVLAKIQIWLHESGSDDCSPVNLRGPAEHNTWERLTAQHEGCPVDLCQTRMAGICPFYKASRAAEGSHLIVIDQALLLTDAMSRDRVLPDYRCLIIDEAQSLEDSVTNSLSARLDLLAIQQQFANLGTESTGLLGSVVTAIVGAGPLGEAPPKPLAQTRAFIGTLAEAVDKMGYHTDNLFKAIIAFLDETKNLNTNGEYLMQVRITDALREHQAFNQVRSALSTLSEFTNVIADALDRLSRRLETLDEQHTIADADDLVRGTSAGASHLMDMYRTLNSFVAAPETNMIYWIEIGQELERLTLRMAPLQVAPLLQQYVWNQKRTVIACGNPLRVGGSFEYMRSRLGGADTLPEASVEPAFREEQPILVFLPTNMPEPQERTRYQQSVERGIIDLAVATEGRMLVVFTSFTQLRQATQNMAARLALGNITVFDQADGTSRQALLDGFRQTPRSVLFGTPTLWEGVDTPFAELATLVIVRLPFAVPSDPIVAARSELLKSSFDQYTIPDALLRFRAIVGQIVKARWNRSLIALFDKRLTSKGYGQVFLDCLPPNTQRRATMEDLGAIAKAWLREG
ncbi:MAG TPA: exonuclease domain-containing protein [Aggregatilineales bacterium]|nr:exonuclease domain-containing protein [Aggregatilineales bacterium]